MENSTIIILGLLLLCFYIVHGIFSSGVESFILDVDLLAGKLNLVGKFFKKSSLYNMLKNEKYIGKNPDQRFNDIYGIYYPVKPHY